MDFNSQTISSRSIGLISETEILLPPKFSKISLEELPKSDQSVLPNDNSNQPQVMTAAGMKRKRVQSKTRSRTTKRTRQSARKPSQSGKTPKKMMKAKDKTASKGKKEAEKRYICSICRQAGHTSDE